jgi:hypothetical protein
MEVKEQLEERENNLDIQLPPFPTLEDIRQVLESMRLNLDPVLEVAREQTFVMYMEIEKAFKTRIAERIRKFHYKKSETMCFLLPKGVYPAIYLDYHQFCGILKIREKLKDNPKYKKLKEKYSQILAIPTINLWNRLKYSNEITAKEILISTIEKIADNHLQISTVILQLDTLARNELYELNQIKMDLEQKKQKILMKTATIEQKEQEIKHILRIISLIKEKVINTTTLDNHSTESFNLPEHSGEQKLITGTFR